MDIADIGKVATRKRMGDDVEKLREKVSRETAKIIKLKVAQDTAYWDLKEKLQGVEANHERLQANMVDVQMQHEAISSAYHREVRQRPETLNKLASTRDICDALEEYTARVRSSLRRTQADIDRLRTVYGEAGTRAAQAATAAHSAVRAHRAALADTVASQHAAAQDRLERVNREMTHRGELLAAANAQIKHLKDTTQVCERNVEEGRARIAALQRDLEESVRREEDERRVRRELQAEVERLNGESEALRVQIERKANEARDQLDALRAEMHVFTQRAAEDIEEERERGRLATAAAQAEVAELQAALARSQAVLHDETEAHLRLETALQEKTTLQEKLEAALIIERAAIAEKSAAVARAEAARDDESTARTRLEAELAEMRTTAAEREKQHNAELAARADTVSALMRDVAAEGEARARADAEVKARDAALKDKDAELTKQMTIILELRAEKERLQKKIDGMQATIDNIQKELAGPRKASFTEPAVRDTDVNNKPSSQDDDAMLYTFLSDSSVDLDGGLGSREIQRRFEAMSREAVRAANQVRKKRGIGAASRVRTLSIANDEPRASTPTPVSTTRTFFKTKRLDNKHK